MLDIVTNIATYYLKHYNPQVDILGHPFSHYVHPCDHQQLELLTCGKGNSDPENHVEVWKVFVASKQDTNL